MYCVILKVSTSSMDQVMSKFWVNKLSPTRPPPLMRCDVIELDELGDDAMNVCMASCSLDLGLISARTWLRMVDDVPRPCLLGECGSWDRHVLQGVAFRIRARDADSAPGRRRETAARHWAGISRFFTDATEGICCNVTLRCYGDVYLIHPSCLPDCCDLRPPCAQRPLYRPQPGTRCNDGASPLWARGWGVETPRIW